MELVCAPDELAALGSWSGKFTIVEKPGASSRFFLRYQRGVLRLCRDGDERGVWVRPEEIDRRRRGDFQLGRACGVRGGVELEILDGTAGLGVDGLALAAVGQRLVLVERDEVLWALLSNLLERIGPAVSDRVTLLLGDSDELLKRVALSPDVVYLDPMFPARAKSALPGKRMQYLSELLGATDPRGLDQELIELARTRARDRVVVKRRLKDPALGKPDWQIRGRKVRFDVYRAAG